MTCVYTRLFMCSVSEVNVSSKTPTVFQLFHCYSSWLTLQLLVQACTCYNMYVFAGVILCKFCALPRNNLTENLGTVTFLKYDVLLVQIGTLRSEDGDSIIFSICISIIPTHFVKCR